jgi:hypothetical protein
MQDNHLDHLPKVIDLGKVLGEKDDTRGRSLPKPHFSAKIIGRRWREREKESTSELTTDPGERERKRERNQQNQALSKLRAPMPSEQRERKRGREREREKSRIGEHCGERTRERVRLARDHRSPPELRFGRKRERERYTNFAS